ncbi:MAG: methylated-DNA--[Eggerthellaceae bacterium]|nr:methylated-DNA--[protein]-cysteine S-methyltransferase [Eggerthellaceae bacterium]
MYHFIYQMPAGRLTIEATEEAIVRLYFGVAPCVGTSCRSTALMNTCATQLQEYFAGKRTTFDIPIEIRGSEYEMHVWQAVSKVGYGATRTYAEIAEDIGKPTSHRTVGRAVRSNPLPILIPTHRIMGKGEEIPEKVISGDINNYLRKLELKYMSSLSSSTQ